MSWHPVDHDLGAVGILLATPLDISAAVGTRECAVLIKVSFAAGSPTGSTVALLGVLGSNSAGPMVSQKGSSRDSLLFLTYTNASGVLSSVTTTWTSTWTIMGWSEVNTPNTTVFPTAAFPAVWTDVNVGDDFIGIYNWGSVGPTVVDAMMRASGETADIGSQANRGTFTAAGNNFAVCLSVASKVQILDTGGGTGAVYLKAKIDTDLLTFPSALVYNSAPVASTWSDVSLAAYTGAVRGLALLRIEATGGAFSRVGVRRNGDTGEYGGGSFHPGGGTAYGFLDAGEMGYLVCETDDNGVIEVKNGGEDISITVLAFVPESSTAPSWEGTPEGTTLSLSYIGGRAADNIGLDTSTLELTAAPAGGEKLTAITGGVIQAGWTGDIIELHDGGLGPREVLVHLTGWPETLDNLVTFVATMDNSEGVSI